MQRDTYTGLKRACRNSGLNKLALNDSYAISFSNSVFFIFRLSIGTYARKFLFLNSFCCLSNLISSIAIISCPPTILEGKMKHTGQSSSAEEKSLISLSIISFIRRATRTYTTIWFLFIGNIHKKIMTTLLC